VLPSGWLERLIPVCNENTGGGTGLCLEIHDLAVSKLAAGREKDLDFLAGVLRHRLAHVETIRDRLVKAPLAAERLQACFARLKRLEESAGE
jgi:ribosomal 50S subunit-associated protein YjgA (DUF615 family)